MDYNRTITDIYIKGSNDNIYEKILDLYDKLPNAKKPSIKLLLNKEVIQWCLNDTSFLDPSNPIKKYKKKEIQVDTGERYKSGKRKGEQKFKKKKVYDYTKPILKYNKGEVDDRRRKAEAEWNMKLMQGKRPDLFKKKNKQASKFGIFGEELLKEYYVLVGEFVTDKPERKNAHDLDLETITYMVEVKTGSYFTTGTAGEKMYGVPWKYADVPRLYGKPLRIVCIGGGGDSRRKKY